MKKTLVLSVITISLFTGLVSADIFAEGTANQFDIDFITISGSTNPASGYGIVDNDYRMGTYEITNEQWDKFKVAYGTVTGSLSSAYKKESNTSWMGSDGPSNYISWYEAAQFVNWLNTSSGHHVAYKFTGTQGTSNYTFSTWDSSNAWGGTNLYRHKDAYYFLPTYSEWTKAAYWNGTELQTFATIDNSIPIEGVDSNYDYVLGRPWKASDGSEELNGTFNMMGNLVEWVEDPPGNYYVPTGMGKINGGSYRDDIDELKSLYMVSTVPWSEYSNVGFRVASVPEPTTIALLALGGLVLRKRK